jgi:hypothetical protein
LHNFGAHLGFRYFFTDGFGLFGEAGVPIKTQNITGFDHLNNQFVFNILICSTIQLLHFI